MLCASATWGAALALFGLTTSAWAGLGILAVAGAADALSVLSRTTIVQTHTPDALLGRVTAAETIVGQAGPHLGNLRGGLVAGWSSGVTALSRAACCAWRRWGMWGRAHRSCGRFRPRTRRDRHVRVQTPVPASVSGTELLAGHAGPRPHGLAEVPVPYLPGVGEGLHEEQAAT